MEFVLDEKQTPILHKIGDGINKLSLNQNGGASSLNESSCVVSITDDLNYEKTQEKLDLRDAQSGDAIAAYRLAKHYARKIKDGYIDLIDDYLKYLNQAAEANIKEAWYDLGNLYVTGDYIELGLPKLQGLSLELQIDEYYKKAASCGHAEAEYSLGLRNQYRLFSFSQVEPFFSPEAHAYMHFKEAVNKGYTNKALHAMHDEFDAVRKQIYKSEKQILTALVEGHEAGLPDASYHLGLFYLDDSSDHKKDYRKAKFYLGIAAERGHLRAGEKLVDIKNYCADKFYNIALEYLNPENKEKDVFKAEVYLKAAVENGHQEAADKLVKMYLDTSESYYKSADENSIFYRNHNLNKARDFYQKACDIGNKMQNGVPHSEDNDSDDEFELL